MDACDACLELSVFNFTRFGLYLDLDPQVKVSSGAAGRASVVNLTS